MDLEMFPTILWFVEAEPAQQKDSQAALVSQ
jgi:hypothetical protein